MRILFRITILIFLGFIIYQSDWVEALCGEWVKSLNASIYSIREANRNLSADNQKSTIILEIMLALLKKKFAILFSFTVILLTLLNSLVSFSKLPSLFTAMIIGGAIDEETK